MYRQISVMIYCFLVALMLYANCEDKTIFQAYKHLGESPLTHETPETANVFERRSLYRPPKPYMEVRYFVNDSYMTVLGNPQDPVYVPTVLQGSGNSIPSYTPHFSARKDGRLFVR